MTPCQVVVIALFFTGAAAYAGDSEFSTGPVFDGFGPVANLATDFAIPEGWTVAHSFDVRQQAEPGQRNAAFESAARFINMHVRAGVAPEKIRLAVVIHGKAVRDVLRNKPYKALAGSDNANADMLAQMLSEGVRFVVCGQSAAYYDVGASDVVPGVQMALSAMTAHAILQQQGYTINPF